MIGSTVIDALKIIAENLQVPYNNLYRLINFESAWNPSAKNTRSGARGLIQFTNATAQKMGFSSADDLVKKNPTITDQLVLVQKYLSPFAPFPTAQSLYMSVFYPAARTWYSGMQFPATVRQANPGINSPGDYVAFVDGKKQIDRKGFYALIAIASLIPLIIRKGK